MCFIFLVICTLVNYVSCPGNWEIKLWRIWVLLFISNEYSYLFIYFVLFQQTVFLFEYELQTVFFFFLGVGEYHQSKFTFWSLSELLWICFLHEWFQDQRCGVYRIWVSLLCLFSLLPSFSSVTMISPHKTFALLCLPTCMLHLLK